MANDEIGAAAAVEALKITAANNQQSNGRSQQQQGGRPQGGFQTNVPQGRPSGTQQSGRPSGSEEEEPAAKPQAPTGGGSAQDKIVCFSAICVSS